jgi:DNA-binding transcriptional ArsR family regulator
MLGQISSAVGVQEKILEILRQEGAVPVYKLAKSLGLTYGGAQWHIGRLERRGLVYTVRVGGRRYAPFQLPAVSGGWRPGWVVRRSWAGLGGVAASRPASPGARPLRVWRLRRCRAEGPRPAGATANSMKNVGNRSLMIYFEKGRLVRGTAPGGPGKAGGQGAAPGGGAPPNRRKT